MVEEDKTEFGSHFMVGGSGGDDGGIGEDEGPVRGRRQEQLRGPAFQVIILVSLNWGRKMFAVNY